MKILFIGKKGDFYCKQAVEFVKLHFREPDIVLGKRGDSLPELARWWHGDYIISYLSPWIVPGYLLDKARRAAINFHPGSPRYPGIGCTNFAVYDEALFFGVTCHHMAVKVDTGPLIAVKRFPLYEADTVWSLTQRCYAHILSLFYEIMEVILDGGELPRLCAG
jgi:methionyl-tRNA formyltransferase